MEKESTNYEQVVLIIFMLLLSFLFPPRSSVASFSFLPCCSNSNAHIAHREMEKGCTNYKQVVLIIFVLLL